jgi:hypothetical protein
VTVNDWTVSTVGSALVTSSVPYAAPLTQACAPRVAIEAAVETFLNRRYQVLSFLNKAR